MSLELALQENTTAINTLIDLLKSPGALDRAIGGGTSTTSAKATVAKNGASSKPETSKPADTAAQTPAPDAAATATGAESVTTDPAPAKSAAQAEQALHNVAAADTKPATTYPDVQTAIRNLAQIKGRDAVVALLGEYGAKTGADLKPESYADAVAQANTRAGA